MKRALIIAPVLLLAACSGGVGSAPLPQAHGSPAPDKIAVTATITIPSKSSTSNRALKHIYDVASTTAGILLTVYPSSGTPAQAVTMTGGDISGDAASNCTATGTGRTCTVSFAAAIGTSNSLLAQTYTAIVPANGTVPGGAQTLGAGIAPLTIVSGTTNNVNLTLNPVLASVSITPVPAQLRSMIATSFGVDVTGLDAANNIIVSGSYVDANANPVSVALSLASNPNGSLALSPTTIGAPGTTVAGTYNATDSVAGNASASVNITSAAPYAATAALTMQGPVVTTMTSPQPYLAGTPPPYANALYVNVNGNDPQLWYTAASGGTTCLANYDLPGASGACATASPGPAGLSTDGASTVYAAGSTAPFYYQYNPLTFLTQDSSCSSYCASASGSAYSPTTNALYYTDTSGNIAEMFNPASGGDGAQPAAVTMAGTPEAVQVVTVDGIDSVWYLSSIRLFLESGGSGILATSPPSGMLDMYLANGGNNAYVTVPGTDTIPVFSYNGSTLSVAETYTATQGAPQYIVGNADGSSVWFSETTASGIGIGRIDVTNQRMIEAQIASGGIAGGIVLKPNSGDTFYVLQWSGTASPGHIYEVTP